MENVLRNKFCTQIMPQGLSTYFAKISKYEDREMKKKFKRSPGTYLRNQRLTNLR